MSMPNIPDITPNITLSRKEAINLLLTSIAMEEIGISHILNAEGEKIQYILKQCPSVEQLFTVNRLTERLLGKLIQKEMLLLSKLEDVLDLREKHEEYEELEPCEFEE